MAASSFNINYALREYFFDRVKVQQAIGKAEAKSMSKIGAFIRRTAQKEVLRRRRRVSQPGEAPSVHSKDSKRSLKNILFGYQPEQHSVVVGPVRLNQLNTVAVSSEPVPKILEFGGTVTIHEEQYKNAKSARWFRRDMRLAINPNKNYRTRNAKYAPRPFMSKALAINVASGTITDAWRASINSAA